MNGSGSHKLQSSFGKLLSICHRQNIKKKASTKTEKERAKQKHLKELFWDKNTKQEKEWKKFGDVFCSDLILNDCYYYCFD